MSDKDTFPFWSDEWMKSQQEYMENWTAMSEKMAGNFQLPRRPKNPWVEALGQWEQSFSGAPGDAQPYMHRMLDQGKAFFQMSEEISSFLNMLNQVNKSTDDWKEMLEKSMGDVKSAFGKGQGDLSSFWDQPLEAWRGTIGNAGINPNDLFANMSGMGSLDESMYDGMDKMFSMPGVGPDREKQEELQNNLRLWADFQRAFQEYSEAHQVLGGTTIDRLMEKMIAISEEGGSLDSMREVYDLWVDCAEEAYADFAYSDEYQDVYSRLINSMMALKKAVSEKTDKNMGELGLPTRKGFDSVLRNMQQMRRDLRQLKNQNSDEGVADLQAEVAALRAEVAELKKLTHTLEKEKPAVSQPAKAATRKKRVTKKKVATKKTVKGE